MGQVSDIPSNISKPAQRALASAGIRTLSQMTKVTEAELLHLHGMGPKALGIIREALAAKGKAFAGGKDKK